MSQPKIVQDLEKSRSLIARKVQALRKDRRWTQAELSRHLRLSQSRLSEIEGGSGSFTAEQFLAILRLFNVGASDFAAAPADEGYELQNALARLGAAHLVESSEVIPSERLGNVADVVREVIAASRSPRLITALAPVLVDNADRFNLKHLHLQLAGAGLERRLDWVVDNTLEAIAAELPRIAPGPWKRLYTRAQVVLQSFIDSLEIPVSASTWLPDVLDAGIRTEKTRAQVEAASSPISRRWRIITSLQPADFADALKGARAAHR